MTVLDLIHRSLRFLGCLNIGDVATAAEALDALAALNSMTDAWAGERLTMYTSTRNLFNLSPGQQVYQIGPGGPDWIAPRPHYIDKAGLVMPSNDATQTLERPLRILTEYEFAAIRVKGIQSTLPTKLYYDRYFNSPDTPAGAGVGSGNVYLWPCPTIYNEVALYMPQAISQFTGLTQPVNLPLGYVRALASNLAIDLAPEYGRQPSAALIAIADESKSSLKRSNVRVEKIRYQDQQVRGGFDWMIGEER